ncbi:DUF4286 family protein [Nitratireductor sp. ZSWI3]|uniref:DUF4286 family protein n=1 Tax=Nitratireductor sp. ZSWI3 TaxID=2966359 RepID=UPI00214FC63A|nr:DUF4286 family protein [Nitratireductor sp. ZSWI3]MCR4266648.1 hypothetical protein [Nitratireductor sp. ZSWI3]
MSELPQCLMIVSVRVDPSMEADWNRWYDEVHLPEILACPGFETARRYVSEGDDGRDYITVYRLASPAAMAGEEFGRRRGWYRFAPHVRASVRLFNATDASGPAIF